ncbi:DltD domain-containing protein [Colletotrichum graminicola]|uniref:DltD domain-containing protein n=1 Tax=Colletotrichum graminicola (strain M1.001 / M2 / FGSC 10212) TaxID=645133 RepID=E3QX16_COLGM|nr:DltD domain-containing protein [Colletotrichum graminicola M1.001]EFQ35404.1 DltD domain-containing protein [Colletotrichum graminicola M1.001]WDK14948.1 DltD domain-containing protein [Colletotrichum graminicola]
MSSTTAHRTVKCKTIDGITLEAWLWEVEGPAPAIVMTHGLNCVKEWSLDETADAFHKAGYNVLLYDPRGIGGSEGVPRNQPDPWQHAEDISDVVSYVVTLPTVDPHRVMLWGVSFGASVTACAGAVDPRVAAVLMVAPIFKFIRPDKRRKLFTQLMKDRQSQLRGNEPLYLRPYDSNGENLAGYGGSGGPCAKQASMLMELGVQRYGYRNRITLQTFHKLALFRPQDFLQEMLTDKPIMMVVPENDTMSLPGDQVAAFECFKCPKQLHLAKNKGHMDILSGEGFTENMSKMIGFFNSVSENVA